MSLKNNRLTIQSIRLWFRLFLVNDLGTVLFLFIWISVNILLFVAQFFNYHQSRSYFYLRILISDGVSVARASALCINFNCLLILLPVCRNLLSLIRYILPRCLTQSVFRRRIIRLFDQHVEFHRCVGYAICFWSFIHVAAHVYNYERLIDVHKERNTLTAALNSLFLVSPKAQINPFNEVRPGTLVVGAMLSTIAGITGVILIVCLIMIIASSTKLIRRSFYEIFWFTHHLFIIFFVCLIFHGIQGIVKSQINVKQHNPEICAALYREWGISNQCSVYPNFAGSQATSWKWICAPLSLYIIERILRFIRSLYRVEIIDFIRHQSSVVELRFRQNSLAVPRPGQYIYLKCYAISKFEWHPFTITSSTKDKYVSVHIRTVGNWTNEIAKRFSKYPANIPRLSIDGPYGSPADDVLNYDGVVLIGAGIGVTPYASILKYIQSTQQENTRLCRVYFYWICNTTSCYEWFVQMLKKLENEFDDRLNFLTYRIFLTKWSMNEVRMAIENNSDQYDIWTGLQSKTEYGRPNFEIDFQSIINEDWQMQRQRDIGVFVCGPKQLVKQLQKTCIKLNDNHSKTKNIYFYLNKENF